MKILLSPAKAIDMTKRIESTEGTTPSFIGDASYLVRKLQKLSSEKIGKMMNLSKDLSALNYGRYQDWTANVEIKEDKAHAVAAFNGEVYRGLDAISMTEGQLERAQKDLRILSGLYGILKPLDVISPYRLEMGTKWGITPSKGNLYEYWGDKLADHLNEEEQELIVNLASNEYFKAVGKKALKARVVTPAFKDFRNGEYKTIMVFAKKARGAMARYIIENNITDAEGIKGFDTDGYRFDASLSTENDWVFTR